MSKEVQEVRVTNVKPSILGTFFIIYVVCAMLTMCDGDCKGKSPEYCMGSTSKKFMIEFNKGY